MNGKSFVFLILCVYEPLSAAELQTVERVDLARYAGRWYEVARMPNLYENGCATQVVIDYTLRPDGRLGIRNECLKSNGKPDLGEGYARVGASTAKLRVTFVWPFSLDYWIIDLDAVYRYAAVGEPRRRDLWILSRTPALDPAEFEAIVRRAAQQGYDVSRLVRINAPAMPDSNKPGRPSSQTPHAAQP